jgi:hypothetical protein
VIYCHNSFRSFLPGLFKGLAFEMGYDDSDQSDRHPTTKVNDQHTSA